MSNNADDKHVEMVAEGKRVAHLGGDGQDAQDTDEARGHNAGCVSRMRRMTVDRVRQVHDAANEVLQEPKTIEKETAETRLMSIHSWAYTRASSEVKNADDEVCQKPLWSALWPLLIGNFTTCLQIIILASVANHIASPYCRSHETCFTGTYCGVNRLQTRYNPASVDVPPESVGHCWDCSTVDQMYQDYRNTSHEEFFATAVDHCLATDKMPDRCDYLVDKVSLVMPDVQMLLVAVAFVVAGEILHDLDQNQLEQQMWRYRCQQLEQSTGKAVPKVLKIMVWITYLFRMLFIPYSTLLATVSLILGADDISATTLLLNGVAVVFLTSLDDLLAASLLSNNQQFLARNALRQYLSLRKAAEEKMERKSLHPSEDDPDLEEGSGGGRRLSVNCSENGQSEQNENLMTHTLDGDILTESFKDWLFRRLHALSLALLIPIMVVNMEALMRTFNDESGHECHNIMDPGFYFAPIWIVIAFSVDYFGLKRSRWWFCGRKGRRYRNARTPRTNAAPQTSGCTWFAGERYWRCFRHNGWQPLERFVEDVFIPLVYIFFILFLWYVMRLFSN